MMNVRTDEKEFDYNVERCKMLLNKSLKVKHDADINQQFQAYQRRISALKAVHVDMKSVVQKMNELEQQSKVTKTFLFFIFLWRVFLILFFWVSKLALNVEML